MMTDLKKLRDSDPIDPSLYRQLIGSLMYLENTQIEELNNYAFPCGTFEL
jgi:hypothetical protein